MAAQPVRDVRVVAHRSLILIADYTELVAYGPQGLLWRSGPLAADDLAITRIKNETIHLTGFDIATDDQRYPFTVDLTTGHSSDAPA